MSYNKELERTDSLATQLSDVITNISDIILEKTQDRPNHNLNNILDSIKTMNVGGYNKGDILNLNQVNSNYTIFENKYYNNTNISTQADCRAIKYDDIGNIYFGTESYIGYSNPYGEIEWTYKNEQNDTCYSIDFDSMGNIYCGLRSGKLLKLSPKGELIWLKKCHNGQISSICIYKDMLYTGGSDGMMYQRDLDSNPIWEDNSPYNTIRSIACINDVTVFAADTKFFKFRHGVKEIDFRYHYSDINGVAIDEDEYIYTASTDNRTVKVNRSGKAEWSVNVHTAAVLCIDIDKNGFIYTSGSDYKINKISTTKGEVAWTTSMSDTIYTIQSSSYGDIVCGGRGFDIYRFRIKKNIKNYTLI